MDNFITKIIDEDVKSFGENEKVITRFPPEPNGHLHLGHAKAIWLNFEIAKKYGGECGLRFDDTNPNAMYPVYEESIKGNIDWLGYKSSRITHTSDHFKVLYQIAHSLISKGLAYVCDLSIEELRANRGGLNGGIESPNRNRTPEENSLLFFKMKQGEFKTGSKTLRAKIDMNSPNFHMRDPVLYRIIEEAHPRTGNEWNIYPSYDYSHPLCDMLEGITHSLCTLEFEEHRPFYDWLLDNVDLPGRRPKQIEFARLEVAHMTMSKRKIEKLIEENNTVMDWDDPRLSTISGLINRGYTPDSIKKFCEKVGIAKFKGIVTPDKLEHEIRDELNKTARRVMAVFDPLEVRIWGYKESPRGDGSFVPSPHAETSFEREVEIENNPEDLSAGKRKVKFLKRIYIDRSDFAWEPPPKWKRLKPGGTIRLKGAAIIKCIDVNRINGKITSLICTYEGDSSGKAKGTINWVSADLAEDVEVTKLKPLFKDAECEEFDDDSYEIVEAKIEPIELEYEERVQFMRNGYYIYNNKKFLEIVPLKDSWVKINKEK